MSRKWFLSKVLELDDSFLFDISSELLDNEFEEILSLFSVLLSKEFEEFSSLLEIIEVGYISLEEDESVKVVDVTTLEDKSFVILFVSLISEDGGKSDILFSSLFVVGKSVVFIIES